MLAAFEDITKDYQAGLPQDSRVKWVGMHPGQICKKLISNGLEISRYLVKVLLKHFGFRKRSYTKSQSLGVAENRDAQFKKIALLKDKFLAHHLPVLSIDTKNKEPLGNYERGEKYYGQDKRAVNDHDFLPPKVVPHGIYDVGDNHGYITLGDNKDTSEFVCDNLSWCWEKHLQWKYPEADTILLLCDGGGSNSSRNYIVKQDLYMLANKLDMNILVAHYPAYCSKWNPIEHRLFSQIHRSWEGAIFHDIETVKELTLETTTKTGLKVDVRINNKKYHTGREYSTEFKDNIEKYILFDDKIPTLNYLIRPEKRKTEIKI